MLVTYIRSSSYNNFEYCQMQYFMTYVLGHQTTSGKKAQLGTVVHKVMEVLAGCKKLHQDGQKLLLEDDAIGEVEFTKRKLGTKKFVNEILKRSYDHYTSNCTHHYTNADYKFCDKTTWEALTYDDGNFDPRKRNIVAAEPQFDIPIEEAGSKEISLRARGTPRIANRLLRRVRDYAEMETEGVIDESTAKEGLRIFGIDQLGLDKVDRAILQALCKQFSGGPVGLSTLAISVSEPTETVEDVYEPFLIQQGLLMRTPRGRVATAKAWKHLDLEPPSQSGFGKENSPSLLTELDK